MWHRIHSRCVTEHAYTLTTHSRAIPALLHVGTLTQSQTGKWVPAKQPPAKPSQVQGWNPRMLDQAGALVSPGSPDSTSSVSPDYGGDSKRSRRKHKKRSKRAAQLLAESLDSAAELKSSPSPEQYAESQAGFKSVHSILHTESPDKGFLSNSQSGTAARQNPGCQRSVSSTGQEEEWAGLKGFLHAAHSGQGGLFAAEALRRMSQDSGGVCVQPTLLSLFQVTMQNM